MNDPSTTPTSDDDILARMVLERERRGSVAVDEFAERYPHLATQIRELAGDQDALDEAKEPAVVDEGVPHRLGDFRIVAKIAHGGMGEIYEAVHERLRRRVVIKVIRRGRVSDEARWRFLREQEVLAHLHQTNIVPIFTAGEEGRLQYFVMPYIDGAALHHVVQAVRDTGGSGRTPDLGTLVDQVSKQGPSSVTTTPDDAAAAAQVWLNEKPIALSEAYFRSVAEVIADAADAVQHAHNAGILHRDLKPANIMVEAGSRIGGCRVIDFGLAGYVTRDGDPADPGAETKPGVADDLTHGPMGTLQYMAPEQFQGRSEKASDVWGLGVTLYELLGLRRAFPGQTSNEIRRMIEAGEPTPLKELVTNVPRDLVAICAKAVKKNAGERYPAVKDLGADLRRWLRHEPTKAYGAWAGRRLWLWTKRNPGWAAAWALAIAILLLAGVSGWGASHFAHREVVAAKDRQKAAEERGKAAEEREREQRLRALTQELTLLRLNRRAAGWALREGLRRVMEAAELSRGRDTRDQAAAMLAGLDAQEEKEFSVGASSVLFDPQGKRLLMGGLAESRTQPAQAARVWDVGSTKVPETAALPGPGPGAFLEGKTPVHLLAGANLSLQLFDGMSGKVLREFHFSRRANPEAGFQFSRNSHGFPVLAISADARVVAASAFAPDTVKDAAPEKRGITAVWDGATGKLLHDFPKASSALDISLDGTLLAFADDQGMATVRTISGPAALIELPPSRLPVHCLALSPDVHVLRGEKGEVSVVGRVAVGGEGGNLSIWDLTTKCHSVTCAGSFAAVYAVAFSPDGTLLASGGRGYLRLWNSATGAELLAPDSGDFITSIAFSPDGEHLAVGSREGFGPGRVCFWKLVDGRGIRTMRGLRDIVTQTCFSPDGRWLAALAQDWQVGIWELPSGRLHRVVQPAPGSSPDNAGLLFSPDGKRLAFAAGNQARVWDVESGEVRGFWQVPSGLVDRFAFTPSGQLLLFRMETVDEKARPDVAFPYEKFPRICHVRELLPGGQLRLLFSIKEFDRRVMDARITPDGRYLALEGLKKVQRRPGSVLLYDVATGKVLHAFQKKNNSESGSLVIDPLGKYLAYDHGHYEAAEIVELPSGKGIASLPGMPSCLAPGAEQWVNHERQHGGTGSGYVLHRLGEPKGLVTFNVGRLWTYGQPTFSFDGRLLAWGNDDGTVFVSDIAEVARQLTSLGLGWD